MYDIIDNFLSEPEFKEMKEWASAQSYPSQRAYPRVHQSPSHCVPDVNRTNH